MTNGKRIIKALYHFSGSPDRLCRRGLVFFEECGRSAGQCSTGGEQKSDLGTAGKGWQEEMESGTEEATRKAAEPENVSVQQDEQQRDITEKYAAKTGKEK